MAEVVAILLLLVNVFVVPRVLGGDCVGCGGRVNHFLLCSAMCFRLVVSVSWLPVVVLLCLALFGDVL